MLRRAHDRRVALQSVHFERLGLAGAGLREQCATGIRAGPVFGGGACVCIWMMLSLFGETAIRRSARFSTCQPLGNAIVRPRFGVIEAIALEHALRAARAHRQPLDRLQVLVALRVAR